ncbi:MAG: hypothetical protein ACLSVD_07925 [Eggerthellaceae bacterium]
MRARLVTIAQSNISLANARHRFCIADRRRQLPAWKSSKAAMPKQGSGRGLRRADSIASRRLSLASKRRRLLPLARPARGGTSFGR